MQPSPIPISTWADNSARAVVGLQVSRESSRIVAVIGHVERAGLECKFSLVETASRALPGELAARLHSISRDAETPNSAALICAQLAELSASLVSGLLGSHKGLQPLAIGVCDPGVWSVAEDATSYLPLFDSARLAESTGLNVIDSFPARDVAQGGLGGPIDAIPLWMLLHDAKKSRVFIDLRSTIRLTYIPAAVEQSGAARVMAMEVSPGTALLDRLTGELTGSDDPGGRLAVQGQLIPELLKELLEAPYFEQPPPRWNPLGVATDWFVDRTISLATQNDWSIHDLLCTATHFLAESIAQAIDKHVTQKPPLDQILLSGAGEQNGLLIREIAARTPELEPVSASDLGYSSDALEAASAAMLAQLHLDQVPASGMLITGCTVPRVLGNLTPGSPGNWQRLLKHLSASQPAKMSLRSAI